VQDELAHHVELRIQELIDRGVDPAEARRAAERRVESRRVAAALTRIGRQRNESWERRDWLEGFRQDITFALCQCRTKPAFTLAAVLTLVKAKNLRNYEQ